MLKTLSKNLLNEFQTSSDQVPCWFMRQAGRYLPEYRELRAEAKTFLKMCFTPDYAKEITLQPLRRFPFDAAILFSDILVIPYALQQKLDFVEKRGPVLERLLPENNLSELKDDLFDEKLNPVYQAIGEIKKDLPLDKTLIGFAGGPFTVACYMLEGQGSKTFDHLKNAVYQNPSYFQRLIDLLTTKTIHYLENQIKAGAEVIQLFESWAGLLPEAEFEKYVIKAHQKIIESLKEKYPKTPIISFPRGAGLLYKNFIEKVPMDGIGIDYLVPLSWAAENIPKNILIQGNLDPHLLLAGGDEMKAQTKLICETFKNRKFIFNLGHGIIKETPIDHVHACLDVVKSIKRS